MYFFPSEGVENWQKIIKAVYSLNVSEVKTITFFHGLDLMPREKGVHN